MMKTDFSYFLDIIPPEMYTRTKATICRHIAIFEPREHTVGKIFCVDDYQFVLFFGKAPVMRINNVDYHVKKGGMILIQPWVEMCGIDTERVFKEYTGQTPHRYLMDIRLEKAAHMTAASERKPQDFRSCGFNISETNDSEDHLFLLLRIHNIMKEAENFLRNIR